MKQTMKKKCENVGEAKAVGDCDIRKIDLPVCNRPRWHKGLCRGTLFIWPGTGGCRVVEMRWYRN